MQIKPMPSQAAPAPSSPANPPTQMKMKTNIGATPGSVKERAIAKFLAGTAAREQAAQTPQQVQKQVEAAEQAIEGAPPMNELDSIESPTAAPEAIEAAPPAEDTAAEPAPAIEERAVTPAPLSQQYAILARKDKALRQREQQLKAREAALAPKPEPTPAQAPSNAFDQTKFVSKDELAKNPFGVLNQLGLSYDKLVDIVTNGPSHEQLSTQSEMQAMREEIKALRAESEGTKKSFETSQLEQNEQAKSMMKKEAAKLVASDESYEMLKLRPDALNDVVSLIERTYEEDGEFLSVAEAASQIEELLAEEAMKYARAKKIQSRLTPAQAAAAKPNGPAQKSGELKTLTNALGTTRPLTSKERAILAFGGKLK